MAPVGCWESLAAAIEAGATSVYFGIEHLNMRARSSVNFTTDDMSTIVARCREAGVKTYLTVNTVMYPEDLPLMRQIVDHAHAVGVDAVIASDIAVMQYANSIGQEVHLSTQLNIANTEALKFYAQFADVVVLARELNMEQVASIDRDIQSQHICGRSGHPIRIEMFCHGALCMAVSGKCYLSLNNYGLSADLELDIDNQYVMSPKDLKTIHFLNKMLDAGVRVLKIEGRARGAEYVDTVVRCYREAVEAWQNGDYNDDAVIEPMIADWDERLSRVFNRGFWDGYYQGQRLGEWTHTYGNKATRTKIYAAKCTNFFKQLSVAEFLVEAVESIDEGADLLVTGETTGVYECRAEGMRDADGHPTKSVKKGEYFSLKTDKLIHRGDKLYLWKA